MEKVLDSLYLHSTKRTLSLVGMSSCRISTLPTRSVILSTRAPIGSLAINTVPMATNQGCKGLIPSLETSPEFFAYKLSVFTSLLNSLGKGTTFLELSGDELGRLITTVPSFQEQTQIARFLDHETAKIDALIAEQKRLINLLQEKRQAVISHAVTKGLDPNVPMKDSGVEWLGEVPAHWKVIPLKNTIDSIKSGTSVNASDVPASDGEFGVLKTSCVYSGEFRAKENKTVLAEELSRLSCPVQVGTLIVSRMNTPDLVGAAGLVEVRVDNIFLPDRLWSVSFNETALPKYVYYWTRSESYRLQIKMVCAGTSSSMQNIGQDDFRSFSIALPPLAEQQLISSSLDDKLASFRLLTDSAGRAVELLMERRSALISAAVTGKIDVRDWQPPADESAFDEDVRKAGMEASA